MNPAIGRDREPGIPEGALFFLELRRDGPKRSLAGLQPPVIFRAGQPEIQLQWIGRFGGLAECHQAKGGPKRHAQACFSRKRKDVTHIRSADVRTSEPCREASPRSSAAETQQGRKRERRDFARPLAL